MAVAVLLVVPDVERVPVKLGLQISAPESEGQRLLSAELTLELFRMDALRLGIVDGRFEWRGKCRQLGAVGDGGSLLVKRGLGWERLASSSTAPRALVKRRNGTIRINHVTTIEGHFGAIHDRVGVCPELFRHFILELPDRDLCEALAEACLAGYLRRRE